MRISYYKAVKNVLQSSLLAVPIGLSFILIHIAIPIIGCADRIVAMTFYDMQIIVRKHDACDWHAFLK